MGLQFSTRGNLGGSETDLWVKRKGEEGVWARGAALMGGVQKG